MWKLIAALAAIFTGAQQPLPQPAVAQPDPVAELPVFNGWQSNIIPEQCPVPHFQDQCLTDEIARINAHRASNRLTVGLTLHDFSCEGPPSHHYPNYDPACLVWHFKSYTDQELKLLHNHVNAHTCYSVDRETARRREAADVLFISRATQEELHQDRYRYWNSNNPGQPCGKKKLQQRAHRMRNQEKNQQS